MLDKRFDKYKDRENDAEFLMAEGLVEQNEQDMEQEQLLFNSAVPLSIAWKDRDHAKKIITWDSDFEKCIEHRIRLFKFGGIERYMPWNIYKEMGLNWVNGYTLNQSSLGSCAGAAFRNSQMHSGLVDAKMTDSAPTETGVDIVYALSRSSNGRINWGSGSNGTNLVKYGTEIGNYWTSDIGKYDTRGSNVTQANMDNPAFKARALQNQSIVCFLPEVSFDLFYKACAAGMSIWIGSPAFPSAAKKNSDGISVPSNFTSGAHATSFNYAFEVNGIRYLSWDNQHGNRYSGGSGNRFNSPATGTCITQADFNTFRITKSYGTPFVHLTELPNV